MADNVSIYRPADLVAVKDGRDQMNTPTWFRDNFVGTRRFTSDKTQIAIQTLTDERVAAPAVQATREGRPINRNDRPQKLAFYRPAYYKMKDTISAMDVVDFLPSEMVALRLGMPTLSNAIRANMKIANTIARHLDAIDVREDLLVAEMIRTGKCVIRYAPDANGVSEEATLDFGRSPANDITLATGNQWVDAAFDWIGFFDGIANQMANQRFAGAPTTCLMGSKAKDLFLKSARLGALKDYADTRFTGVSDIDLSRGMITPATQMNPLVKIAQMGALGCYWFNGSYTDPDTDLRLPLIAENEVIFFNSNAQAAICNFPILDMDAQFEPLTKFSKTWPIPSPSGRVIETQAAILPFIINPDATLRAIVA